MEKKKLIGIGIFLGIIICIPYILWITDLVPDSIGIIGYIDDALFVVAVVWFTHKLMIPLINRVFNHFKNK
jgi:uncharacterized membrane protein YkvA (DUF1232 family)